MRKLFTVTFIIITATATNAQMRTGIKAGYAMSTIWLKVDGIKIHQDVRSTYYIGLLSEITINKTSAFQFGLTYSPLGSKQTIKSFRKKTTTIISLGTISIPLFLKYHTTEKFALSGGMNVGFNFLTKLKEDYHDEWYYVKGKILNLAPFVGLEYNFSHHLFMEARLNLGISNISKEEKTTARNNFILLGVGYKF